MKRMGGVCRGGVREGDEDKGGGEKWSGESIFFFQAEDGIRDKGM